MAWEGLNRRKFPRANYPCLVKIRREGEASETLLTHTENISSGGVCVVIKKQFEIFAGVGVEVDLMDGGDIVSCGGRVVWAVRRKATEQVKPSFYDIGIEFMGLKEDARLRLEKLIENITRGHYKVKNG